MAKAVTIENTDIGRFYSPRAASVIWHLLSGTHFLGQFSTVRH